MKFIRSANADISVQDNQKNPLTVETFNNHIYFYSGVNSDRCLDLIKQIRLLDDMLRNERTSRSLPESFPMTPIWLHINSPGGSLMDALSVADQIKTIKSPIYSIGEGMVASAATFISMSCDKRYLLPSSHMLIHQLSSVAWGKYEEIQDELELLDMLMETMKKFYKTHSKLSYKEVGKLLKRDSWFNAKQSISMGLADEIFV